MPKHITDVPTEKITKAGKQATLEARQKALESGQEVISKDANGKLISERMHQDGYIVKEIIQESPGKFK